MKDSSKRVLSLREQLTPPRTLDEEPRSEAPVDQPDPFREEVEPFRWRSDGRAAPRPRRPGYGGQR